jgi:hypothetical protein
MKRGIRLIANAGNQSVVQRIDDATPVLMYLVLDFGNSMRSIRRYEMPPVSTRHPAVSKNNF